MSTSKIRVRGREATSLIAASWNSVISTHNPVNEQNSLENILDNQIVKAL